MKKKIEKICRTCRWAEWEKTPTGRVKRSEAGHCVVEIPGMSLPVCCTPEECEKVSAGRFHKTGIWWDYEKECPFWEGKE